MNNKSIKGFTLVELIVVITILAILWTLAFISLQWYSRDSRDSARISDLALMKKSLWVVAAVSWKYPDPDNFVEVTYSGATVLKQWTFWDSVRIALAWNISKVPLDPLFDIEYNYSVINIWNQFEVSTVMEGWLISYDYDITNQAGAVSDNEVAPYVSWDYYYNDIKVSTGSNCYVITIPGLTINNFTSSWEIDTVTNYRFLYDWGTNIPTNYLSNIDVVNWTNFQVSEVYNKCSIDTIDDLNLYVSNLSRAYQQLNWVKKFENIIFTSHTTSFKLGAITRLKKDEILASTNIAEQVKALAPYTTFSDSFSWSVWTLIKNHSPDIGSFWSWSGSVWGSHYEISADAALINDGTVETIYPVLSYWVADTKLSFDIIDIAGGEVYAYSNYYYDGTNNNYYELKITPTNYTITQKIGLVEDELSKIDQTISPNSKIDFNVVGNIIIFSINNVEKERIIASILPWIWNSRIRITPTIKIDNYTLSYK